MPEVTLSSKGQIVVPKEIREKLGLNEGDRLSITLEIDHIALRPSPGSDQQGWKKWRGRLRGTKALKEHLTEHADEVRREHLP